MKIFKSITILTILLSIIGCTQPIRVYNDIPDLPQQITDVRIKFEQCVYNKVRENFNISTNSLTISKNVEDECMCINNINRMILVSDNRSDEYIEEFMNYNTETSRIYILQTARDIAFENRVKRIIYEQGQIRKRIPDNEF